MKVRKLFGRKPFGSLFASVVLLSTGAHSAGALEDSHDYNNVTVAQAPPKTEGGQQEGISDTEIQIGSCIAQTGTLQERGHEIARGANTYFSFVNDNGGINGRKIKLTVCDDAYQPEKAIECFNNCLKNKVFVGAFFAGSAPISKYVRMGDSNKLPLFGFCTGTPVVYEFHPTEFVLRASYVDEIHRQIQELQENRGLKRIAILYQNDAFGAAIRANAINELKKYNLAPVAEASYSRLTADIDEAFNKIKESNPQVVIMGAISDALKAIIKKRAENKWNVVCICPSIATDYVQEAGSDSDGIIISQVVPAIDSKISAAATYNKLRKKYTPDAPPNLNAFEGFINAMVLTEALKETGRDLTKDKFVKTMESIRDKDFGLGPSFKVGFSPTNHVAWGSSSVYFQIARNGKLETMSSSDWKSVLKTIK